MPVEKLEGGNWPHPSRLPLGSGWTGFCTAPGHEGETPAPQTLENECNLGYASSCAWAPTERNWDGVRFAVSAPSTDSKRVETARPSTLRLNYVCERCHRPADHGFLDFDLSNSTWAQTHPDPRIQKMAECFLQSYMQRRS